MKINYDGSEYELDLDEITVSQAVTIKRKLGLTLLAIEKGMAEVDVDALRAVYWLMVTQSGKSADIDRLDFKPVKLATAIGEAVLAEAEAQAEQGDTESPKDTNPT